MTNEEFDKRFAELQQALGLKGFTLVGTRVTGGLLRVSVGLSDAEVIGNLTLSVGDIKRLHFAQSSKLFSLVDQVKDPAGSTQGDKPVKPGRKPKR